MRHVLVAAASCVAAALPSSAVSAAPTVENPPYVVAYGSVYYPGDIRIVQGGSLSFANLDPDGHDLVSAERDENGNLYFRSEIVYGPQGAGGVATAQPMTVVQGVSALGPGIHMFTCSLHAEMRGTIEVLVPPVAVER
jgi:plastocyanin